MPSPLLIVDGDALAHRAYHGMGPVKGSDGRPVGALLGVANMLVTLVAAERPRATIVGLDSRRPGYRNGLWPDYQAQRPPFDAEIVEQLDDLPAFLAAFGVQAPVVGTEEADDVIATLATLEEAAGGTALVLTSDRDAYQLVSAVVTVLRPTTGVSALERVDIQGVVERYGVLPEQVPALIALRGDPSDNIPGARGIGVKTAAKLLATHGDLGGVLAARPDIDAIAIRTFLDVATMRRDLALTLPADGVLDLLGGADAAETRGMHRLAERLRTRATALANLAGDREPDPPGR